jgi:hypothetical protein
MTTAALRVPRYPQERADSWFAIVGVGSPGGVMGGLDSPAMTYNGKTYVGYVDPDGNIRVASYTHSTRTVAISPAIVTGVFSTWHCAPAVLVRSSDHKLVVVAPAFTQSMYVAISSNAEDVSAWGAATDIGATLGAAASNPYVYANLFQLSGESGKVYLVYATQGSTHKLCFSTSTDGGATWAAQTQLYSTANTNYSLYACGSDFANRIDFLVSDGAASAGDSVASAYHFYYSGGSYFKTDGTTISAGLPLAPSNLTKIYDGATNGLVRSPSTIITNGGNPVATWASYNTGGSGFNENYWYGIYTGGAWVVNKIDDAGSTLESPGSAEGGTCSDLIDPTIVYLSKKTSSVWQLFKYQTANNGSTWTNTQLTFDASQNGMDGNVKPYPPINAVSAVRCLWNSGVFGPQSAGNDNVKASCQIRGYPRP